MREIKNIVVHCTGGSQKATLQTLKNGWKKLGWKNPGYHYLIDASGIILTVTPESTIANGVAGHNSNSIHVSYIGGIDAKGKAVDNRTEAQKKSLITILTQLKAKYPTAKICGHRDFSPDKNGDGKITSIDWVKVCPCFDAISEYKNI